MERTGMTPHPSPRGTVVASSDKGYPVAREIEQVSHALLDSSPSRVLRATCNCLLPHAP